MPEPEVQDTKLIGFRIQYCIIQLQLGKKTKYRKVHLM